MTPKKIIALVISLGVIVGGWIFVDDRNHRIFALADSLKRTNQQLQLTNFQQRQHILQEQAFYYQRQMNAIINTCKTSDVHKMPADARKLYQHYELELTRANTDLQNLK